MSENDVELYEIIQGEYPEYDFHVWADALKSWKYHMNDEIYYPCVRYKSIKLDERVLTDLRRNLRGQYCRYLEGKVDSLIEKHNLHFFRFSTRSPKDAWMHFTPSLDISEEDDVETKIYKMREQIACCHVNNFSDIRKLVLASERLQEDIDFYFEHCKETPYMALILQEWRDFSPADEVRCFVRNGCFIAACRYHILAQQPPDIVSLSQFMQSLLVTIPNYTSFVADVFLKNNKWYLIELNPFDEITDPIIFDWQALRLTPTFLSDETSNK